MGMKKVTSKTAVLFLWAAWLLLTAHSIIPHDHHSLESFGSIENSCPASQNNSDHHSKFPSHCHALNDLTSEKAVIYFFPVNISSVDFVAADIKSVVDFESYLHSCTIIDLPEHLPVSHLLELSPFRAPPVLS
jgi:hypothetical protein